MSTQYRDGSWSDIEQLHEAYKTFQKAMEDNVAQKFVVGQDEDEVKEQQKTDNEKIKELKARLDELQAKCDPTNMIKAPTFEELQKFGSKED